MVLKFQNRGFLQLWCEWGLGVTSKNKGEKNNDSKRDNIWRVQELIPISCPQEIYTTSWP
jgi:hypothetical protein